MHLELTEDEALVLFELFSRHEDDKRLEIRHRAERIAVWSVVCELERQLVAPLRPDYDELVQAARDRLVATREAPRE